MVISQLADGQNFFALVSYAPKPLATWLLNFRRNLAVAPTSEPHITILPPRPLKLPVHEAEKKLNAIFARWDSFEIELGGVCVFPSSNVLYLEVNDSSSTLPRLHAELNTGDFAHQEDFEFHPHITIGGPVDAADLESTLRNSSQAWQNSGCPRRFLIEEVAFVSISAGGSKEDWRRLWTHNLNTSLYPLAASATASTQTF